MGCVVSGFSASNQKLVLPAVVLASIGCLQPGIDPVFLTLLSAAHGFDSGWHGWVVTATQSGMALGSLATWRLGSRLPQPAFIAAAMLAAAVSLATAQVGHFPAMIALRALYGGAMGVLYTQAMANASANRPHGSYGAVFLFQLLLASAIALVLPAIADVAGPKTALSALAAAPLAALALVTALSHSSVRLQTHAFLPAGHGAEETGLRAWAAAGSCLLFICSTMMVWTFAGGLAVSAGLPEDVIGDAVALGSLAGAGTAIMVMREKPVMPPPLSGILAGLALLAPIAAVETGDPMAFIAAIVALNIGCTAIITRTSGLASAASRGDLFRRFVACTHALGMILGPLTGSLVTAAFGPASLLAAAICTIALACLFLFYAEADSLRPASLRMLRTASDS